MDLPNYSARASPRVFLFARAHHSTAHQPPPISIYLYTYVYIYACACTHIRMRLSGGPQEAISLPAGVLRSLPFSNAFDCRRDYITPRCCGFFLPFIPSFGLSFILFTRGHEPLGTPHSYLILLDARFLCLIIRFRQVHYVFQGRPANKFSLILPLPIKPRHSYLRFPYHITKVIQIFHILIIQSMKNNSQQHYVIYPYFFVLSHNIVFPTCILSD